MSVAWESSLSRKATYLVLSLISTYLLPGMVRLSSCLTKIDRSSAVSSGRFTRALLGRQHPCWPFVTRLTRIAQRLLGLIELLGTGARGASC